MAILTLKNAVHCNGISKIFYFVQFIVVNVVISSNSAKEDQLVRMTKLKSIAAVEKCQQLFKSSQFDSCLGAEEEGVRLLLLSLFH